MLSVSTMPNCEWKDYPWHSLKQRIQAIVIENSVTFIGVCAFSGYYELKSVTLPDTIKRICNKAFQSCSKLESITFPNSVTSIGERAFYRCSNLTSITLPSRIRALCKSVFSMFWINFDHSSQFCYFNW